MRYAELKTWEDFAKALSQNPDPRNLTYLIERLNRALDEDERKSLPSHGDPMQPSIRGGLTAQPTKRGKSAYCRSRKSYRG
jgi:hypothetical protein